MSGKSSRFQFILYVIFFLSGASGLVYEVIWVRLTGLVFGNTSHAIAVVLGAFMAGLALGSWKIGGRVDGAEAPLRMYGILEIGVGLSAAVVPFIFRSLDSFYWAAAPSLSTIPGGNGLVRFITSFAVLLIPTFLMGGTLPVLARFITHTIDEVERKVGVLYALNTFGAAAGTLVAALFFIPVLGNVTSTFIIAALNIAIGFSALWLQTHMSDDDRVPEETSTTEEAVQANSISDRLILLTLAVSGFASMLYEVAWTRALTAMIGSSTYAFSIMLVTFLVGIALGSSLIGRFRPSADLRLLGVMQLGVAFGGFVFLVGYLGAPYLLVALVRGLFYSFPAVLTTQFLLCASLMIFATIFMGATLPVASQLYSTRRKVLGRRIGNIYSINTLGAIAGSLAAGFLFIPLIGTERTILLGLLFNSAIALLLLTEGAGRVSKWIALVLLLTSTISMRGAFFWKPDMLDRGILVYSESFDERPELSISEHYEDTDVVYFKEGNNASISVRRGENYLGLRTNGKVDASNRDDMLTQLMIGYLPGFYHPSPESALIVGYGSGVTVGAVTAFDQIKEIDCIEIEPAVVGAGRWFGEINRKSYENPKVNIVYDDARSYMNITRKQYDIIISEPSNPWIAGVASLFTAEFYERAAQVLKPDGVFAQWVQLYQLDPEDLRMILKEFQRQFPEVSAWVTGSDLMLIGTAQPQKLDLDRIVRISRADPSIMRDYRDFLRMSRPEGILAYYVMSSEEIRKFAVTERRNTDDHPLLEFHAPRQLFSETRDLNLDLLYEAKGGLLPVGAEVSDLEAVYSAMVEPLLFMKRPNLGNQAMALLAVQPRKEEASLQLALTRINIESSSYENAQKSLETADQLMSSDSPMFGEKEELWGMLYESLGAFDEALPHYQRAAQVDPSRSLSRRKLAEIYAKKENWVEAAKWMEHYIETKPTSPGHYWAMLGDFRLASENREGAFQALQTALTVDPYSYWAHYRLARLFELREDSESAINEYEFILKYAYDRDAEVYLKLANLYRESNRISDALRVLKKGHRIFPTNAPIYRLYQEVQAAA